MPPPFPHHLSLSSLLHKPNNKKRTSNPSIKHLSNLLLSLSLSSVIIIIIIIISCKKREKSTTPPSPPRSSPPSSSSEILTEMVAEDHQTLVFTYGTLKTGFSNHGLIQDMIRTGDAIFIGSYRTIQKYPLVCGPFRVPFLLNLPGKGDQIKGELYAVSDFGLTRMDELEGITKGHYERLPIEIVTTTTAAGNGEKEENVELVKAVAYYGHRNYAEGLWKRNGEKGFCEYSKEETKGYVKRDCRPKNVSFLEQIRLFISSSSGFN